MIKNVSLKLIMSFCTFVCILLSVFFIFPNLISAYEDTQDGQCAYNHYYCDVGTSFNKSEDSNKWYWWCAGPGGGVEVFCDEDKPKDGVCGSSLNTCNSGSFSDLADDSSNYYWRCNGSGAGASPTCSYPKAPPPVNGRCGGSTDSCNAGSYRNTSDSCTKYYWDCEGLYGGGTANCSTNKPAPGTFTLTPSACYISDGKESYNLSWTKSSNASSYRLYDMSFSNGSYYLTTTLTDPNQTSYKFSSNDKGTHKYFKMIADNCVGSQESMPYPIGGGEPENPREAISCSYPGVCSTTVKNQCTEGTFRSGSAAETSSAYTWTCDGINAGATNCSISKTVSVDSISVTPNPVPYNSTTTISFTSTNAYYCRVIIDGKLAINGGLFEESGYFNGNTSAHNSVTGPLTASGSHTAWVLCYLDSTLTTNSGWQTAPFTVSPPPPSVPNLTASPISINAATVNVPVSISATISNIGGASTNISFSNFFQVSKAGVITDKAPTSMAALGAGASDTATVTHTFTSIGTYSVRVCADKTSGSGGGVITESDEDDNCGTWKDVVVSPAPNTPPNPPSISGPSSGNLSIPTYIYTLRGTDPDGDQVKYGVDWDMNGSIEWVPASDLVNSGSSLDVSHNWSSIGNKTFRARTYDSGDLTSDWTSFTTTITAIPQITVTVSKTYGGSVISDIGGINCGSTCSKVISAGTNLTLTAVPDSDQWQFVGWQGDCSGTATTCTLPNIMTSKSVMAIFALKPLNYQEF